MLLINVTPNEGISFLDMRDASKASVNAMSSTVEGGSYLPGGVSMATGKKIQRSRSCFRSPKLRSSSYKTTWAGDQVALEEHAWCCVGISSTLSISRVLASCTLIVMLVFTRTYDKGLDPVLVEKSQHFCYISSSNGLGPPSFKPSDQLDTLKDIVD